MGKSVQIVSGYYTTETSCTVQVENHISLIKTDSLNGM